MKKDLICILCPRGCRITVDTESLEVTGNACPRGAQFGPQEISSPERMLTSTAPIEGALYARIPVRTSGAVPFSKIPACIAQIKALRLKAPVRVGDILVQDIAQTGINLIASRNM